jgi:hypothetical protein
MWGTWYVEQFRKAGSEIRCSARGRKFALRKAVNES